MRNLLFTSIAVAALAMAGNAWALGNETNNNSSASSSASASNNNANVNQNTATGGQGGDGGTGVGIGIGKGGQGGTGVGVGGDQQQGQGQEQGQSQGQSNTAVGSGNSVNIESNTDYDRPAFAPDLGGMPNGPCTGESGGISIGLAGFAGGGQYASTDYDCTLRYNIMLLNEMGMEGVAKEMVNDLTGVRDARARMNGRQEAVSNGASPADAEQTAQAASEPFWCDQRSERIQRAEPECFVD